jgi:hypothetical protein
MEALAASGRIGEPLTGHFCQSVSTTMDALRAERDYLRHRRGGTELLYEDHSSIFVP